MKEMADLGLTFAEELCPADDVLGRRWLVQQVDVPFIADESAATPADVTREILGGSATAVSIKTARTGFTDQPSRAPSRRGPRHRGGDGQPDRRPDRHRCARSRSARRSRCTSRRAGELSNFLDMSDDLLAEPLEIRGGELVARSGPGLGAVLDPDKLAHYRQH